MKTIKDLNLYFGAATDSSKECRIVNDEIRKRLKRSAIEDVKEIQAGSGLNRDLFPESMKGEIAKDNWDNSMFSYGMEYGYLLCLMEKFNLTEEDIKEKITVIEELDLTHVSLNTDGSVGVGGVIKKKRMM